MSGWEDIWANLMFVKSKHARSVRRMTLIRVLFYVYLNPQNGYLAKLRRRFGSGVRLLLNSDLALDLILKNLPDREPGMLVVIEQRMMWRYKATIERLGLRAISYSGEKQLIDLSSNRHVLAVVLPDSYSAMSARSKKKFDTVDHTKIVYQNTKRPKAFEINHDIYIWEPRGLPRTASGAVVVVSSDSLSQIKQLLLSFNNSKKRMSSRKFIREIYWATKGFENRYRRIDIRPPRVLARVLYDFYK